MPQGFNTVDFRTMCCLDFSVSKILDVLRYTSADGTVYEMPAYQPTDFASVPRAFWGPPLYLIPTGWYAVAALFHDSAFQNRLLIVAPDGTRSPAFPSADDEHRCNALLLEMMRWLKPNPTAEERAQMDAIFAGVTLGGWHAFKEDRS